MASEARKDEGQRDDIAHLAEVVERLEKVVGRFCVLGERLLASNDSAARRSGKLADTAIKSGVQVSESARELVRRKLKGAGR